MCHYCDNDGDMPCQNIYWCSGCYEQLGSDRFAPGRWPMMTLCVCMASIMEEALYLHELEGYHIAT